MLTAYRRHGDDCPDRKKGQNYSLCGCPIWCYGKIDGKSVRQSLRTTDPVKAANRMEMIERGEDLPADMSNSPTVTFGVKCFLTSCSERGLKASTLDSYRRTLSHLEEYCGNRLLASIDVRTLDAYRSNRVVKPVLKKGVMQAPRNIASGTWRKELETIRDFFSWAFDRKWMAERPASKLKMPRTEELVTAPFTAGEVHDVLDAVNDITTSNPAELTYVRQRARALVYVLLYSGLRISDVAALERSQLNGQHLTLRILKNGVRLKVLLHKNAVNSLASLPSANPRYFFWSGTGNIITCITNLRRTIYRLGQMAGVHAHPHRFRDTFAVELLTNGADIRTVQKLLGHKSIRTTEKHYAHFVAAHQALLDSAAATLDFERPVGRRPALVKPLNNRRRYA